MDQNLSILRNYLINFISLTEKTFSYNKEIKYNEIFKNSMFFIDEKKFEYLMFNNLSLLINKIQEKQKEEVNPHNLRNYTIERFFNCYFLNFYNDCGDFSSVFLIIIFNLVDLIHQNIQKNKLKYKNELNEELKRNFYKIVEKYNKLITENEFNFEAQVIYLLIIIKTNFLERGINHRIFVISDFAQA
jgi:hypothetical protein